MLRGQSQTHSRNVSESLALPLCFDSAGREKRKGPMISAGDAEFPRDYPLAASRGRRGRQFPDNSNGGFTSASLDRRHNSVAAKSLEALNNIHKADIERQRDALMDLQKTKYSNSPGSGPQGTATGRQVCPQQRGAALANAGGVSTESGRRGKEGARRGRLPAAYPGLGSSFKLAQTLRPDQLGHPSSVS